MSSDIFGLFGQYQNQYGSPWANNNAWRLQNQQRAYYRHSQYAGLPNNNPQAFNRERFYNQFTHAEIEQILASIALSMQQSKQNMYHDQVAIHSSDYGC